MREFKWVLLGISIGIILTSVFGSVVWAQTQDNKPVKILTGEQLYAINCNRCHTERYPTERTEAQLKTIMMHMQIRANLPPDQAKKILKFLKENN